MTDDSDFAARYLQPDNTERREHPSPHPEFCDPVAMPAPQLPEPGPSQQPPTTPLPPPPPPSARYEFAPPAEFAPPRPGGAGEAAAPPPPPGGGSDVAAPTPAEAAGRPPSHSTAGDGGPTWTPPAPAPAPAPPVGTVAPGPGQWAAPPPHSDGGPSAPVSPPPIPPMPRLEQHLPPPAPQPRWGPHEDPAERWTPRAHPGGAAPAPHRQFQIEEVSKTRRESAKTGWRKVVYQVTGHLVNLGAGPAEQKLLDDKALIASNIPGNYQIATVSVKGGVGKTCLTAAVGSVFASERNQPVVAIDADTTYGGLGRFVDPKAVATLRDFLAANDIHDYPKARFYTGQNTQGLEVLAGNQNVANPMEYDAKTFFHTISLTRRFYQLSLVDCGAEIEHEAFKAVLSASNALMIVGSCSPAGGLAVETTIDWLAARNGHELLKRSVIVLNDTQRCANTKFITHITETLGERVRAVKTVPWDPHLRDAATLNFAALSKRTRLALIDLAAELAAGFPTAGALSG